MQLVSGAIIAGRFRLERPLSRGGMGSVWAARHAQLGHPMAVKFMDPKFAASPAFRARFEREARTAANLQSPHVVQVQDYGIEDGTPWLVMELLHGEDLDARLKRCRRISLQETVRILAQAGKALRRAHDAGLVHRDLKPGNLFLARVEDDEVVKVLDFGIAKESGSKLAGAATQTGEVLGSPFYMSPEQVRGDKELDHRSDLWSLGVIVFRALTGELPFSGDQLGTVMAKILVDPIPIATQQAPDLPGEIDGFFAKAFARDRAQRFQTVRELLDDLSRIAGAPRATMGSISDAMMPPMAAASLGAAAPPAAVVPLAVMAATPGVLPQRELPDERTMRLPGQPYGQQAAPLDAAHASSGVGPAGTLTSGGVTGTERAPRSRVGWFLAAGGAAILVGGIAVITMARLGGGSPAEPAAAGAETVPAADSVEAAPAAEVVEPVPTVEPVEPAPAIEAPASATVETAAPATTVAPREASPAPTSTATTQAPAPAAKSATAPAAPKPPASTAPKPPKKNKWGV